MKLYQKAPEGLPLTQYPKYCSIDGDADRLLYFFLDKDHRFHMLDGDRFSVLFTYFIAMKLKQANLIDHVNIGVIQTAYANGSSTDYIEKTMVRRSSISMKIKSLSLSFEESPSGMCSHRCQTFAS